MNGSTSRKLRLAIYGTGKRYRSERGGETVKLGIIKRIKRFFGFDVQAGPIRYKRTRTGQVLCVGLRRRYQRFKAFYKEVHGVG